MNVLSLSGNIESIYFSPFFVMFMKKVEVEAKIEIALCRNKVKHVLVVLLLVKVSTDCFKNAYWVATGTTLWFLVNC